MDFLLNPREQRVISGNNLLAFEFDTSWRVKISKAVGIFLSVFIEPVLNENGYTNKSTIKIYHKIRILFIKIIFNNIIYLFYN